MQDKNYCLECILDFDEEIKRHEYYSEYCYECGEDMLLQEEAEYKATVINEYNASRGI